MSLRMKDFNGDEDDLEAPSRGRSVLLDLGIILALSVVAFWVAFVVSAKARGDEGFRVLTVPEKKGVGEGKPRYRLVSDKEDGECRKLLPDSRDGRLGELRGDVDLIWYDERVVPRCYQDTDGALGNGMFLVSAYYNISAVAQEQRFGHGNANVEFPWGVTAGVGSLKGFESRLFLRLPVGKGITVRERTLPTYFGGANHPALVWEYPSGTTFGEVLITTSPDGWRYAFEVRLRTKSPSGKWHPSVYRPFPSPESLAKRVREVGAFGDPSPASKLLKALEPERPKMSHVFLRDSHPGRVFPTREAVEDVLPGLPAETVRELLTTTPFERVREPWRVSEDGKECWAPTTDAEFHVVPKDYHAAALSVARDDCMSCHDTVLKHARSFDGPRDWYGRVRGSDGIFSFHPFEPGTISGNGGYVVPRLRRGLVEAGVVVLGK